ncbi:MAG: hypothetical protein ACP5P3_04620 [Ignavibacteria bacterium]
MKSKKAIIVEFYTSHDFIMQSQISYLLDSGYQTYLWINKDLPFNNIFGFDVKIIRYSASTGREQRNFSRALMNFITENHIDTLIINSAHGKFVRNFCIFSKIKKLNVVGNLHLANKLKGSFNQKLISLEIKKYFVLADYIFENCQEIKSKHMQLCSYYRLLPKKFFYQPTTVPDNKDFIICIPGEISPYRRNYYFLIDFIKQYNDCLDKRIKFELLGNARIKEGYPIIDAIKSSNYRDRFIFYDYYLPDEVFFSRLKQCNIITPLIDNRVPNFTMYSRFQISGAFDLAYIFQKPLLLYSSFEHIPEFRNISIFYNEFEFSNFLNNLLDNYETVNQKALTAYQTYERYNYEKQRTKYIKFIEEE